MFRYIKETIDGLKLQHKASRPDYQQQLPWDSANERVLLAWEAKAIAQYWKDLGIPAIIITCISLCLGLYGLTLPDKLTFWTAQAVPIPLVSGAFLLDWCVKTHFVYRITESGIEFHSWRIYPDFLFSGIKLLFVVLGLLALIIGIIGQQGLLVITGPVTLAIVFALPATDKGYKKAMLKASHDGADWSDITKIQYDSKKRLLRVDYNFEVSDEEKQKVLTAFEGTEYNVVDVITDGEYDLFLTQDIEQQALSLIQHALPNLTLEMTKLRLPDNP